MYSMYKRSTGIVPHSRIVARNVCLAHPCLIAFSMFCGMSFQAAAESGQDKETMRQ